MLDRDKVSRSLPAWLENSRHWLALVLALAALGGLFLLVAVVLLSGDNPLDNTSDILIRIESRPPGAYLIIDRYSLRVATPAEVRLTPGSHELFFLLKDRPPWKLDMVVEREGPRAFRYELPVSTNPDLASNPPVPFPQPSIAQPTVPQPPVGPSTTSVGPTVGPGPSVRPDPPGPLQPPAQSVKVRPSTPSEPLSLRFQCAPTRARLSVNGEVVTVSPTGAAHWIGKSPESVRITANLAGFRDFELTLSSSFAAAMPQPIRIDLVPGRLPVSLQAVADTPFLNGLPERVTVTPLAKIAPLNCVLISAGTYRLGVPPKSPLKQGEQRERTILVQRPFYMAETEISNKQFAALMKDAPQTGPGWRELWIKGTDHLPVRQVPFTVAKTYAELLGGRLPTEQEWEVAGRGSEGRMFPWGTGGPRSDLVVLKFGEVPGELAPVDSYPQGATPLGLKHLLGNVAEWCDSIYTAGEGDLPSHDGVNRDRVIRGGSFLDPYEYSRLTMRAYHAESGSRDIGFRIMFSVPDN